MLSSGSQMRGRSVFPASRLSARCPSCRMRIASRIHRRCLSDSLPTTLVLSQSIRWLPMLDAMVTRETDGKLQLTVYRKKTHTDQYLSFTSHHPLHQKLGVVRTLLDRSDTIITQAADKQKEEEHIKGALKHNVGTLDGLSDMLSSKNHTDQALKTAAWISRNRSAPMDVL